MMSEPSVTVKYAHTCYQLISCGCGLQVQPGIFILFCHGY